MANKLTYKDFITNQEIIDKAWEEKEERRKQAIAERNTEKAKEERKKYQANGKLAPPRPETRTAEELKYKGANPATAINPTVHVGIRSRNAEIGYEPEAQRKPTVKTREEVAEEQGLILINDIPGYKSAKHDADPNNDYLWQQMNYVDPLTAWELSLPANVRRDLQRDRRAEARKKEMADFAEEHPVLGTVAQLGMIPADIVMSTAGGFYEMFKKGTADYFNNIVPEPVWNTMKSTNKAYADMFDDTGLEGAADFVRMADTEMQDVENYNGIDVNNPLFMFSNLRTGLSQGVTNAVDVNIGGTDVFDFAYGAGTAAVESVAAAVIPGGHIFLGTKAGAEAMRSAKQKGLSDEKAIYAGVFAGVIEAVTERIPLENLKALRSSDTLTIKGAIKNVLKQSATEGTEESISETANIIYDLLMNGNLSDYNIAVEEYIKAGYTPQEAKKKAREELIGRVVESFAQGALAGGMSGGVSSAVGYSMNRPLQKEYGTDLRQYGDINEYVQIGLSAPVNTEAHQIAKDIITKKGKVISDAELGALALAVEQYEAQASAAPSKNSAKKIPGIYKPEVKTTKNKQTSSEAVNREKARNKQTLPKAQTTQSAQTEEAKALTPAEKVQTVKPTIGRTAEGKVISVSDISGIKNGQIFVKTSDGKTQALKYADIENAQARKVWQTAAKNFTDPIAAKAFIDNYNGEVVTEYAKAFNDYYQLASTGLSLERIDDMGIAQGNISLAAKVAAVDAGAMSVSFRKGVVDQTTTKKTKMQSLQMQMLDSFGKKYGLNITFVDTLGDYNGFYKPGTNQTVVGLDASEGAVTRTVGHEVYHYIKDANKEGSKKIEDFVLNSLKKLKGEEWVQNKLDSYDKSIYKTEQERIDELVADSMFDVFTNEKTVQEFVKQDRSLAQRVLDRVKTLIADIRNIYNKLIAQGSDEIAALRDELKTLEKIRDLFFEALDETAPAVNQKQKNTAEAVKKSYKKDKSGKVQNNTIRTFSYEELTSKPNMKLTVLSESIPVNDNGKIDRSTLVDKAIQNVKSVGHTNKNGNGEVFVKDVGRNVAISKASVRHGIDRRIEVQAPVLMHIGEVISDSIEINQLMPKKATASDSYILLGAAKDNDNIYVVSSIVNRYTNSIDSIDVLYSANIKKESAVSKTRASGNALQSLTDSTISISNLLDVVKEKSPEILSNDVLKHYGLMRGKGEIESALKFSTKSKPNLDPDGVQTLGKRLVESDLTKEGGLNYNFEEHDPLSFDDRAMPNGKSSINWVYKAEIFSNVENKMFHQKLAEIRQGSEAFVQTDEGYYIVPIENKLVFTDGDFNRPYIDRIVEVLVETQTRFDMAKEIIYDVEAGRQGIREASRTLQNFQGEGAVLQYTGRDNRPYGWADRKPKGRNRRAAINNYINQQIRKRNASKSGTNQSVIPSAKPTNPIREEVSDYINNRSDMQAIYKTIDKRYRIAGKTRLNEKSIESFANKILSQTHSKYSKELLTERLTALFEFMANSRDFSWDDIMQITAEISKDVLSQSSRLDTSMREEFSDTLKWLKGIDKVYISPEVRAEIDATFGSLDSFRRQIGSRMKITVTDSNAITLDSVWSQLAGDYPGVFDSEITPLDQPAALADFFEMTKPTYQNPYEMDMDEAAYDYALRIYDQYFDIPEVKTEAQKHQLAMDRLRGEFNKKLDAMRNEYKAREQAIRREGKLEADNRVAREKLLNRQRQEAYREKRFETELRQKYRAQILRKLNGITKKLVRPTDSEHISQELIKSINDFAKTLVGSGAFTSQKADNLKRAFDAIGEAAQNPNFNLASMYDEDIAVKLENLKEILDGKRFPELTSGELKKVREITDYFAHIVKMSNEAFSESIKERISDLQSNAMDSAKGIKSNRKRMETAFQAGLLKPVTFFELIENPTIEKLYTNIRNGEADWYRVVNNSKNFLQKIKKEHNYKSWKKDTVEFTTERGKTVILTVGEAMSVYATARRKQGIDHLMKGGIVRESDGAKKIKKLKKDKVNIKGENISLTIKDIQQITSALTDEQKGFANKMVEYLSTDMAELGNKRTMRIFGIRKFNESNYFPLRSASNFLYTKPGVQDDARIKHMSMTKKTTPHANNPVIIGDFTEVAMNHCNDMALYYGFVLALEDFTRVYNYKTMDSDGTSQTSVKQQLERAFGNRANQYIMQMLTDVNGGVKAQAGANVINKMMSKAKKDAVFASLSVAVQQPSAIARTMLYLNPKYLAKTMFSKRSWNELKEYAPVAGVKEMGYFDANIGRQAVDWMLDEKYEGLKEKAFALIADGNYRDDLLSFLPAYMDRVTWCHIWEAVKAETKAKTDLEVGSKEFLEAAGERFTYIIDRTQVYDSVFSRSEWMRSKDTGMKTVMAFMAEPVTNLNMLYNAAVKARHGDGTFLVKALGAYTVSVALNAALKALVSAGRDDDEEKSYAEKYLSAFISGVVEEPFGMIPYLKDAISLIKGYDSKRMDTQVIANFVDAIGTIFNSNKSEYEKLKAVASAVGTVLGVPVKNIWRDTEMIYNGVMDIVNGTTEATTDKGIEYAVKGALGIEVPDTATQYLDAYFDGDTAHADKTYANLSEKYEGDEEKINTQIKKALRIGFEEGKYTEEQTVAFLKERLGMDKNKAYWQVQEWSEGNGYSKYGDFIAAVDSGENLDEVIEEYSSHGADKSDLASAMSSYYKEEYLSSYESDPSVADEIERKMLAAYKELGYDYDENYIYWKFKEWEGGDEYEKYGEFYDAIDSGNGLKKTINIYLDHGVSKQTLAGKITSQYKEEYIRLYKTNPSAAGALRRKLIEAYAALGYNRADKAKDIDRWLK